MPTRFKLKPLLPLLVIGILSTIAYAFAYADGQSLMEAKSLHVYLKHYALVHPFTAPLLFMGIYIAYTLLSLPGIFILSLLAGFLFNQPFSTLYVTLAATIGSSLLFLAVRSAFGSVFSCKVNQRTLGKMQAGFQKNATHYLLFLRLIPLFPFFIVNIAGALFAVPFRIFAWTTFVGMIPSVFVYTQAGKGLTLLLDHSASLQPSHIFNLPLLVGLLGLALLSLLPLLFKKNFD